jgi:hypothetical protein
MPDKSPEEILRETQETARILKDTFASLSASIRATLNEAMTDADATTKQYIKNLKFETSVLINSLGRKSNLTIDNQLKLQKGQIESKKILSQIEDIEAKRLKAENEILRAYRNGNIEGRLAVKLRQELERASAESTETLKEQVKHAQIIEQKMHGLGDVLKGISKIPILGNLIDADKTLDKMKETAGQGGSKLAVMGVGLKEIGKSIAKYILNPLTIAAFLFETGFKADKQVTELGKQLVITKGKAYDVRSQFIGWATSIGDGVTTLKSLIESNSKLVDSLGLAKIYSSDINHQFILLTKVMGISEESAANLAKLSIAFSKPSKQLLSNTIAGIEKVKEETGLRLNNRKLLEETLKISGQILSNYQGNPIALAKAVAQIDALGSNMSQTVKQSESLLNWESSIDNELKSELLTGRQLNLEKARAAALMGDQATVAKELSAQAMDYNSFSKLNVIQQKALAESLGLNSNELADQLLKQQYLGKSKEQIIALGGDEAAQRMEAISAQDKFNSAVEKLQDLLGSLMAGPVGKLIDGFANIANHASVLYSVMGAIAGISLVKLISGLASMAVEMSVMTAGAISTTAALTLGIGIPVIAAAIAAMMGAFSSAKKEATKPMQDGFIDPQKGTVITSPAGTFQTRPDDKIMVGTDIKPTAGNSGIQSNNGSINIQPLVQAINEVRAEVAKLSQKEGKVYLDGRQIGSMLVQGTYKTA